MSDQKMTTRELLDHFLANKVPKVEWIWYDYCGEGDLHIRYFTEDGEVNSIKYTYFKYPNMDYESVPAEDEIIFWSIYYLCIESFPKGPGLYTLDVSSGEVRRYANVYYDYERQIQDEAGLDFDRYLKIDELPHPDQSIIIIR